jgi:hypothetical protein
VEADSMQRAMLTLHREFRLQEASAARGSHIEAGAGAPESIWTGARK